MKGSEGELLPFTLSPLSTNHRNTHAHRRPLTRNAGDAEFTTEQGRPLAHAHKAERFGAAQFVLGDATTVVAKFQMK